MSNFRTVFWCAATPDPLNDGPGNAVHIWDRTGQQPLFAAGNAAGDIEMLDAARFALLGHHDDPDREYGYVDITQVDRGLPTRIWIVLVWLRPAMKSLIKRLDRPN